jgi:hypothetical protein
VSVDPDDFKDNGFLLRQVDYDPPRRMGLFIVMPMYDEEFAIFPRASHAVIKNITYLCSCKRRRTWGKAGWKEAVSYIVSDRWPRYCSVYVTMIIFSISFRPKQPSITESGEIERPENGDLSVQIIKAESIISALETEHLLSSV